MFARAVLVTVLLSSPGPSKGPDLDRLQQAITAGSPHLTSENKLAPLSDLLKATEEAAHALETARPEDLHRLMNYTRIARLVAYDRTRERAHACALIEDCDVLLQRADAPDAARREAYEARGESTAICTPRDAATAAVTKQAQPEPSIADTPRMRQRRGFNFGWLAMGAAAVMTGVTVQMAVYAVQRKDNLRALVTDLEAQGYRTDLEDLLLENYHSGYRFNRGVALGLGISAAVFWGLSGWVFHEERMRLKAKRMEVSPYSGPQGAGLSLRGSF